MNGKKVISLVKPMAEKIVSELGYVLVDVEYKKQINGMVLELFIDSPNGISINDCEAVSKAIDLPLDELNPTNNEPYSLNVSSLGLDRPIKTDRDLARNVGNTIDVSLYAKLNGVKDYEGELKSFDETQIVIAVGGNEVVIPRESISKIKKHISF